MTQIVTPPFPAPAIEHSATIYWPNGEGETPCTPAYLALIEERDALLGKTIDQSGSAYDGGARPDDLEPAEYERYHWIENELGNLMLAGHVAKSVRYDEEAEAEDRRDADRIDGFDRDDIGESPDY